MKVSIHIPSDYTNVLLVNLVHLYKYKERIYTIDVNEVRFEKYYNKYQNENKVVNISTLLPC